uniref:SET domain-containing protein n=1 Tax=Rodentolepis nana TaxID=102285 RepID=A0A0R3T0S3_RODNA
LIFIYIFFVKMDIYMDMDIAAEETSSLLHGQKFIKPFSNFFQTAKQKFADFDPESAVHLVGPMFELTAPIDKDKSHQDFDAVYPEKCVSYGPTICSFGLSYNDHNYAKPVGLTPPVMAPHLMDDYPSRSNNLPLPIPVVKEAITDAVANNSNVSTDTGAQLLSSSTSNQAKFLIKTKEVKSPTITVTSPSTSLTNNRSDRPTQFDVPSVDPSAGLSDSKKALFAAWHAKAAASGGTLLVQHNWKNSDTQQQSQKKSSSETEGNNGITEKQNSVKDQIVLNVPRYCRSLGKESEGERVFLESDMKILEVPEELCVSPSKLSSLDSSDEEDLSGDGAEESELSQKPAMWSTVSCVCEMKTGDSNMIQCLNCRYLQHLDCMNIAYADGACTDEANPTAITPKDKLLDPATYLCPSCIRPTFTLSSELFARVIAAQKERETNKQKTLYSFVQHNSGKADPPRRPIGGAHLIASATDRARQLGLIGDGSGPGSTTSSKSINYPSTDERVKMNCIERQNNESTDINLRIPSPPRASKRKQDLKSKPFVEQPPAIIKPSPVENEELRSPGTPNAHILPSGPNAPTVSNTPLRLAYQKGVKIYSSDGTDERSPNTSLLSSTEKIPLTSPMGIINSTKKKRSGLCSESPQRMSTGKRGSNVGSTLGSAWAKDYREADTNVFSENLLNYVDQRIKSGRERIQRLTPTSLGRTPLCRVVMFDHDDKGLEASARLGKGEVVTELRGNLMLMEEYEHFVDPINESNRYVMIYQNFGDRAIAINATQYGNDARFIRRSCIPNCFLDHFIVCDKLRIIIRTTQELMPGVELTIPFDFDYRSCRYAVKCACARSRCPVQKWCRKLARNKVMPNLDYGRYIEYRLNALSKPITDDQSPTTPGSSRSYSTDNSPVPSSSHKIMLGNTPTPTSSTTQRYTPTSSNRPFPAARLFTSPTPAKNAPIPSTSNCQVPEKSPTDADSYNDDENAPTKTPTANPNPEAEAPLTKIDPVEEQQRQLSASTVDHEKPHREDPPPPSKKRRSTNTDKAKVGEKSSKKEAILDIPPFQPIITTRRQAAKFAAIATKKTPSTRSSSGSSKRRK